MKKATLKAIESFLFAAGFLIGILFMILIIKGV